MIFQGFLVAVKSEAWLAVRNISTYLVILLPFVFVVVYLLLNKMAEMGREVQQRFINADTIGSSEIITGYGHLADSLLVALTSTVLIATTYAAWTFSNDCRTGSVRHVVIRVASRHALILSKFALTHVLAALSLLLAMLAAFFLAEALWSYQAVVEQGYELIAETEIHSELFRGVGLAAITVPAAIALGTLVSVSARSPVQAVLITLSILVVYGFFQPYLGTYAEFCFLTFTPMLLDDAYIRDVSEIVRGYSDVYTSETKILFNVLTPIIEGICLCVLTYFVLDRRRL